MNRFALISGPVLCGLSVALGAFGAHAIADITTPERLATWHTAAKYLMSHGIALLIIGMLATQLQTTLKRPTYLIFLGASVFSATLFILVLSGKTWLGAIAPLGGLLMIVGWIDLVFQLIKTTATKANT